MKKVIITGSSRGIGRAIAINLARAGYDPVLHCVKNRDALKSVADEIRSLGATGDILQFDIADRAATQAALTAWVEANGAPFGVVLNAGIADDAPFPGLEDDQWDRVLRTDLDGFYNVLKPLVLPMVQARTRGRIIALSSISGVIGNRGQTNYSAAKAGIIGAAKALAVELARRNITVNCVAPGVIETEMIEGVFAEEAMKMIPMRRFGKPEEVAAVVKFLLSEEAAYITRQVIQVNGGMF
ncbi:MAG: 3-oxoacyl-ACP reductase FabG [Kiritimatiellae bacterium]|nr:3-oxoacyl-ACP reductase FabG [Kiritimatiellia bacterium]